MKLSTGQASAFFAKPDADAAGVLIHGADAMRIALHRQKLVAALIGPMGEEEMRLTRVSAADLRKTPALLLDAVAMGLLRRYLVENFGLTAARAVLTQLALPRAGAWPRP